MNTYLCEHYNLRKKTFTILAVSANSKKQAIKRFIKETSNKPNGVNKLTSHQINKLKTTNIKTI